jgi:hypothetical protein
MKPVNLHTKRRNTWINLGKATELRTIAGAQELAGVPAYAGESHGRRIQSRDGQAGQKSWGNRFFRRLPFPTPWIPSSPSHAKGTWLVDRERGDREREGKSKSWGKSRAERRADFQEKGCRHGGGSAPNRGADAPTPSTTWTAAAAPRWSRAGVPDAWVLQVSGLDDQVPGGIPTVGLLGRRRGCRVPVGRVRCGT